MKNKMVDEIPITVERTRKSRGCGLLLVGIGVLIFLLTSRALFSCRFFPDVEPVSRRFLDPPPPEGPFAPNTLLDEAQLVSDVVGAECFVPIGDDIVTGLLDGRVVRIKGNETEVIVDCDSWGKPAPCGRPLGLRFNAETNELFVADSINGLFKININDGIRTILYDPSIPLDGVTSQLTDDLVLTREGDIYFTDASTRWGFDELHLDFAEGSPNGRILHYNPRTGSTRILLDQLYFPNGIQLSPDEDYFLFCESSSFQIHKYYLRGPLRDQVELFVDNLPGYPDNIRASGRGTFWVALPISRSRELPSLAELLAPYPNIMKLFLRLPYLLALTIKPFEEIKYTQGCYKKAVNLAHWIVWAVGTGSGQGFVVELDQEGNVLRSLQAYNTPVRRLSTALEHRGVLYLGSPWEAGVYALNLESVQ